MKQILNIRHHVSPKEREDICIHRPFKSYPEKITPTAVPFFQSLSTSFCSSSESAFFKQRSSFWTDQRSPLRSQASHNIAQLSRCSNSQPGLKEVRVQLSERESCSFLAPEAHTQDGPLREGRKGFWTKFAGLQALKGPNCSPPSPPRPPVPEKLS